MSLVITFSTITMVGDDWQEIIDITYNVVEEQVGRGKRFDQTLARVLQVAGPYMVSKRNAIPSLVSYQL